jgi:hypothetical protein
MMTGVASAAFAAMAKVQDELMALSCGLISIDKPW